MMLFELSGEPYGVDLGVVQEVIQTKNITHVPQTSNFVTGVINLRGYVLPVVNLKKRFGMAAGESTRYSRIIIVDIEDQLIGVAVDRVTEIVTVPNESIDLPSPLIRSTIKTDYLEGFTEVEGELVKILNLSKIFSTEELNSLRALEQDASETEPPPAISM